MEIEKMSNFQKCPKFCTINKGSIISRFFLENATLPPSRGSMGLI